MDGIEKAAKVLREAEATLRALVSDAAAAGDYSSVVQIAAWARTLSDVVKEAPSPRQAVGTVGKGVPQVTGRKAPPVVRSGRASTRESYPRFFRSDDRLVRVAWSKREKKEYEHKAPYSMLKALSASMAEKGIDGRIFSTDQILPIHDDDGAEIPSYQAYVGIALFKHAGLLDQHGRQGYSIPALPKFKNAVEGVWRNLPEK